MQEWEKERQLVLYDGEWEYMLKARTGDMMLETDKILEKTTKTNYFHYTISPQGKKLA